ncbi:hypothetical protein [Pseudomonas sp. RIT-PI-S]|uniref:hypothetical protein n=1 Tax=Pseudomonas sp. RIT-PI-S TaxID=3035295 RepID=UPI0021DB2617|nr:hypothetical protein [Pseudomonas sp. RIT-PI-S]
MIARLLLLSVLLLPIHAAEAAKKTHPPKHATPTKALELTPEGLQTGMKKYIQEEADCRSTDFGKIVPLKGARIRQQLEREGAKVNMVLDVAQSGQLTNIRFAAEVKDQAHLTLMLCATYATMRTLQPTAQPPGTVKSTVLQLWQDAQQKPSAKPFYSSTLKAQMTPFELNVY